MTGDRRHPGEHRFPGLACLIKTTTRVERHGKVTQDSRFFIASEGLTPERAANAIKTARKAAGWKNRKPPNPPQSMTALT